MKKLFYASSAKEIASVVICQLLKKQGDYCMSIRHNGFLVYCADLYNPNVPLSDVTLSYQDIQFIWKSFEKGVDFLYSKLRHDRMVSYKKSARKDKKLGKEIVQYADKINVCDFYDTSEPYKDI